MIYFLSPYLRVNTWRVLWPAVELQRRGFDVTAVCRETMADWGKEEVEIPLEPSSIILLHVTNQLIGHNPVVGTPNTPGAYGLTEMVKFYRRKGHRVWLSFDDDYMALGDVQEIAQWWRDMMADHCNAIREAAGIVVATEPIGETYARWANDVRLCRNWVPEALTYLPVERAPGAPMAGWFGTLGAHRRDWAWLGAHAKDIRKLGVVGEWEQVEVLTGRKLDWHSPIVDAGLPGAVELLYRRIGQFSVGIAPVADDVFNGAKSWIKPLEFAALGIPTVTGAADCYRRLADDGFAFEMTDDPVSLAELADSWLAEPPTEEAQAGLREQVRDRYTLEGRGGDEWQAWAKATGA